MNIKTVIEVDYHEVEEIIEGFYGKEINYIADNESSNDTYDQISAYPNDEYDTKSITDWLNGEGECNETVLLIELMEFELIPVGDYLVSISW